MRIISEKVVEENKIKCLFDSFFYENRAVCEIMWKNKVQRYRPQKTIPYGACAFYAG
jgi:hypothetical protein